MSLNPEVSKSFRKGLSLESGSVVLGVSEVVEEMCWVSLGPCVKHETMLFTPDIRRGDAAKDRELRYRGGFDAASN